MIAAPDSWNPDQYERFAAERALPFHDLVGLVEGCAGGRAVDLGCGTGQLTAGLHRALSLAETVGIDNSPAMLARAAEHAGDGLSFAHGDIATFRSEGLDLVFSNAALQWVTDHAAVLGRWAASLRAGGQLAVQLPANGDHPSHWVAEEVAAEEPFGAALADRPAAPDSVRGVLSPESYAEILWDLGFQRQHVRLQVYGHRLASTADVVEWVKGTTLNRYRAVMADDLFGDYLVRYRTRLREVLGDRSPYFYPFKRILFTARLP
ncbi:MAG TPA: methyltransferase domain-containing protein [Acidimicrobiales bacterium]|nr:methyltransferase domain-containing protein [Acidimicrobiales bacterium]